MNKIITQSTTAYSAYIGILFLYLKLLFVEPLFIVENVDFTLSLFLLLIVFSRVVFKLVFRNVNVFGNNKSAKIFWLYIVLSTVSSFFMSPNIAFGVVTVNLLLFLVYLLFIDFQSVRIDSVGLKKVISGLVYFAIINTLLVFYTFFFGKIGLLGEVSSDAAITRAFGLMGDQLPWFLSFFALHALYCKKTFLFIFFGVGILMGASVGATIILIISSFIYIIKEKKAKASFYLKAGYLVVLFFIVLLLSPNVFNKIGILQRFNEGQFTGKEGDTSTHRLNAINHGIDNIFEKPLFGHYNYALAMTEKYDKILLSSEKSDLSFLASPNNELLVLICDYGFVGFILFIFFIYGLLKKVGEKCLTLPTYLDAFKKSAYLWLIVFILFNQSATWFLPGSFLWVLICLIIAISYKINQIYGVKQKNNFYS